MDPPRRRSGRPLAYNRSLLLQAVADVQDRRARGMAASVRETADRFHVPKSTLHRHLKSSPFPSSQPCQRREPHPPKAAIPFLLASVPPSEKSPQSRSECRCARDLRILGAQMAELRQAVVALSKALAESHAKCSPPLLRAPVLPGAREGTPPACDSLCTRTDKCGSLPVELSTAIPSPISIATFHPMQAPSSRDVTLARDSQLSWQRYLYSYADFALPGAPNVDARGSKGRALDLFSKRSLRGTQNGSVLSLRETQHQIVLCFPWLAKCGAETLIWFIAMIIRRRYGEYRPKAKVAFAWVCYRHH